MSTTGDLRAIADGATRDLDAVHDFFEHSMVVWESFQLGVTGIPGCGSEGALAS